MVKFANHHSKRGKISLEYLKALITVEAIACDWVSKPNLCEIFIKEKQKCS